MADRGFDAGTRTVLVTGGTGFIGRPLCRHILRHPEWRLRRLVRPAPGRILDPTTDVAGDLQQVDDVQKFVEKGDSLIHLACTTTPRTSDKRLTEDIERNLATSVRLFDEFLRRNSGGHIVFASTGGDMYTFDPPHVPRRETDQVVPHSGYSTHKLAAEQYLRLLCARHGGSGTVLRIGNPYGERVSEDRGHGLIGIALIKALLGHELEVLEPLDSVRDYLHVDDLVAAFVAVIRSVPGVGCCETFNVGSGSGCSIGQVIETVQNISGRPLAWRSVVAAGQRASWNVLDSSRFSESFGWTTTIPFAEGVRRLWGQLLATQGGPG